MSADPADALSLDELERWGRVWGTGNERRALCPYCDHPKRDREHATLAFNVSTGAWHCHRCNRSGLLAEHWTKREDEPLRLRHRSRRRSAPPVTRKTSAAELADKARRRAEAAALWRASVPLDSDDGAPGLAYLQGRGIPPSVAIAADIRYHSRYPDRVGDVTHYHGAVVFKVQGEDGAGVAIETRFLEPHPDSTKSKSRGPKGDGVFVALPGALDADGLSLCEGALTALSMAACGYPAVSLSGQNAPPWLLRRLALRRVIVALDEGETKTEEADAAICTALARVGAKVYRLRLHLAAGNDVNDLLQAAGLAATRARLDAVICAALLQ